MNPHAPLPLGRAALTAALWLAPLACVAVGACSGAGDGGASDGAQAGSTAAGGAAGRSGGGGFATAGSAGSAATGGGAGGKPPVGCGAVVTGTVRDFHAGGDFQCDNSGWVDAAHKDCGPWDPEIVGALGAKLGPDKKPVYAASSKTPSTTGAAAFARWFGDAPGTNLGAPLDLTLSAGASGTFALDTKLFFPIDGKLFAATPGDPDVGPFKSDDGQARNFHFTYELHTTFRYDPGNVFTFRGDDDVFVYVNGKLAVNLGGIHVPMQAKLALDTGRVELTVEPQWESLVKLAPRPALGLPDAIPGGVAGSVDLGLEAGQVYDLDFFFAERNCCASNFRVETNLVFIDCGADVE